PAKLFGLERHSHVARFGRADRKRRLGVAVVISIDTQKNARRIKPERTASGAAILHQHVERAEFSEWRADLPLSIAPINHAGRILAHQRCSGSFVWIVKG